MSALRFEILARSASSQARLGRVHTAHGSFDTPAFMPVGTRGSVKGLFPRDVARAGAQIVLNNTYHLLLRPGPELVERMGGVHRFMNWNGPILTDSGGYQAYSMSDTNAVDDDGVTFKSVVDGSMIRMTPEVAIRVQNQLGADIIMAFDDCPPAKAPGVADGEGTKGKEGEADQGRRDDPRLVRAIGRDSGRRGYDHARRLEVANERTARWLERCVRAHGRAGEQSLFGIIQGGTDLERRTRSREMVCGVDLPGYAIGGVAVGEPFEEIARVVRHTAPGMPESKPRYLMGVGYERDLLAAVLAGVDMFDCVLPTRNGRNANAFTRVGQIRLRNAKYAEDAGPIETGCDCAACDPAEWWGERDLGSAPRSSEGAGGGWFSRGYLRHLFMAGEMLGPILVSLHNIRHFQRFMADVRGAIGTDGWAHLSEQWPIAREGLGPVA